MIAAVTLSGCGMEIVDTGYRGIQTRFGEVIGEPLPEGLYFYNPFTSSIREYNVRTETLSGKTEIFTKDTQAVIVDFTLIFSVDPKYVTTLYKEYGSEEMLGDKIIKPVALGSIKDAVGLVIADELVSKREMVTKATLKEVQENLATRHVLVTDLQFTNLNFDDAYERAVEEKVVAIQEAQKAKNVTVSVEEQAKQTLISAKASAEAMRIQSQALAQNKGLIEFEAVKRWDGKLPQYMFGGNTVPFIDIRSLGK